MHLVSRLVSAPDGRNLCIEEAGDPSGYPVLIHNGAPSSRHIYPLHAASASQHGIRLISYDRPGYGRSSPHPGRSMLACIEDVRAIAQALEIERMAVWGFSMGGPHALACAAALPEMVSAVAVLASFAPYGSPGLDYGSEAERQELDEEASAIHTRPDAVHATFKVARDEALAWTPQALLESWKSKLAPEEASALTAELASYRVKAYRSGLGESDEGWWEDDLAYFQPWGFSIDSIRVPVILCHGQLDHRVPTGHFDWFAEHIPEVETRLIPEDGHLSLFLRGFDLTCDFLRGHLGKVAKKPH